MYEKIIQKLKLQRGQRMSISDKSIEDLAKSYGTFILTDDQLNAIDFNPVLESISGNISHIASEAAKKAEEKTKKELEGKKTEPIVPSITPDTKKDDGTPEYAKAMMEAIKTLSGEIFQIKGEKIATTRKQILESKLKETPDIYKNTVLKAFDRATFKDDDDFNSYVAEIEKEGQAVIQEGREKGLVFSSPGKNPQIPDPNGMSPEMEKTLKAITEVKEIKKPF